MFNFYIQYEYWFAVTQLVLAMLGMGATLTIKDFTNVFVQYKSVAVGMLLQLIYVPIVIFLFINLFGVIGGVAVGFAIIAAIPGGTTSNIFTYILKGNSALSIALTALTTILCIITTPHVMNFLAKEFLPAQFMMPYGKIAIEIILWLLLPLGIGMLILKIKPNIAPFVTKWGVRTSLLVIVFIAIGAIGSGRLDFQSFGIHNALLVILLVAVLAISLRLICRLIFRLSHEDTVAIEMEGVVRTTNLGLLIKASLFPAVLGVADPIGDMALFVILFYGGTMLITAAIIIFVNNTIRSKYTKGGFIKDLY